MDGCGTPAGQTKISGRGVFAMREREKERGLEGKTRTMGTLCDLLIIGQSKKDAVPRARVHCVVVWTITNRSDK